MPGRPYLLDNLGDETSHAGALTYLMEDLAEQHSLAVATGYVNLGGLHHLARIVSDGRQTRLLLGAAPDPALGAQFPVKRFELALIGLAEDRDLSRFPPSRAFAQLASIDRWLQNPNLEVRRFLATFLHGKAYLFGSVADARAALVTSANLTGAGLFANLELGLTHYDPPVAGSAIQWFEDLWAHASEYKDELRALLFPDVGLIDPQTVYLRALLELYGDQLLPAPPVVTASSVSLAPFQRDGFERARTILARHHGVIFADGVGTGKTEIGLAFIEEYALQRGQHALVVAPAQLVSNWQQRISQARLPAQVVSYQQLASDEQLMPDSVIRGRHLHNAANSYRLVVVDEGHALRNPDTTWHRAMERLLGGDRKDLVLLTATPINNGLWDLYHLVMVFGRHDRAFAAQGIDSVRELFLKAGANDKDPANLDPDTLFPLADAVSVRRDRRFIERHYPGAIFPDGTPVRFPQPVMSTERYDLDAAHPGLFSEITGLIGSLRMARYRPTAYMPDSDESSSEAALGGLLQSGILKRFESCWHACALSVDRMIAAHDAFVQAWESGVVLSAIALRMAANAELEDAGLAATVIESLQGGTDTRPITDFRPEFRHDVATDRNVLTRIRDLLGTLSPSNDRKLQLLERLLDECPSQKVAVFSTFGDTIAYLDLNLRSSNQRSRVVVIGSESDPDTRTTALARFSPQTVVRPDYVPPDGEVDLLLSTDVLSEGQNLQQAGAVISYDMPWNPQRVVQRNGRVVRLKSPHNEVYLTTMLPEPGDLEQLLRLEETIRRKVLAASLYGMETEVIEGPESELRSFAARLEQGDETLLEEDSDVSSGAFAGEELRSLLQRALAEGEVDRLGKLPWGIGAVFRQDQGVPSSGNPGIFFACRTRGGQRYWRFVEMGTEALIDAESEILRRIDPGSAPPVHQQATAFNLEGVWALAVSSIVEEHNRRADPRTQEEGIGPAQRFAIDLLRDPAVTLPSGADQAEEALTVGRSSTVRQALTDIKSRVSEGLLSRSEAADRIVEVVKAFGLQAVSPPPPLEPITEDDVGVVCWMGVLLT
ncbi:MAG: helicase-related protein [Actinomycetota bacterium]